MSFCDHCFNKIYFLDFNSVAEEAASEGHLKCLIKALELNPFQSTIKIIENACFNNHVDVLMYAISNNFPFKSENVVYSALKRTLLRRDGTIPNIKILRLVYEKLNLRFYYYHFEILLLHIEKYINQNEKEKLENPEFLQCIRYMIYRGVIDEIFNTDYNWFLSNDHQCKKKYSLYLKKENYKFWNNQNEHLKPYFEVIRKQWNTCRYLQTISLYSILPKCVIENNIWCYL